MSVSESQPYVDPSARPEFSGVIVNLMVDGASAAIDFYIKAFGAEDRGRVPDEKTGKVMHAYLVINDGALFINDVFPEYGQPAQAPQGFAVHLQVDDVKAWWSRAVDAGAEIVMPLDVQFWGDRYGQLRDPFGVTWSLGGAP